MSPDLLAALEAPGRAERLLVALDFDGTISPIVAVPSDARPVPGALDLLGRLAAAPGTQVVLVSGRSRRDLAAVSGAGGVAMLIGSHGQEIGADLALTEDEVALLAEVRAQRRRSGGGDPRGPGRGQAGRAGRACARLHAGRRGARPGSGAGPGRCHGRHVLPRGQARDRDVHAAAGQGLRAACPHRGRPRASGACSPATTSRTSRRWPSCGPTTSPSGWGPARPWPATGSPTRSRCSRCCPCWRTCERWAAPSRADPHRSAHERRAMAGQIGSR